MDILEQTYPEHIRILGERYAELLEQSGFEGLLLPSGEPIRMFLDDMDYPFKANPHFKAWLPIVDNPHCHLLVRPGETPTLLFAQPEDYWHKAPASPEGYWVPHFEIVILPDPAQARGHLPADLSRIAAIGDAASLADWGLAAVNPSPLMEALHYHRAWKTPYEQQCIRLASALAVQGHEAARAAFYDGRSEFEIHLAYLDACGHMEHELPYGNIIALNRSAAVLHYTVFERERVPREHLHSFLIDAGASFNGYAADITRSYSLRDDEFAELIAAMDEAQQALVAEVAPGVLFPDLHESAHRRIAELLARFGFVHMEAEEIVAQGISRTFLPHGLGHYLGLQVHDVGGFSMDSSGRRREPPPEHPFLRLTRQVEAGQVFTIEPGLYFIRSLLESLKASDQAARVDWERVAKFECYGGIRIEDNVLVTEDGRENITRDAFASAAFDA